MSAEGSQAKPEVLGSDALHTARWLQLNKLTWRDGAGKTREWESLSRTTRRAGTDSDSSHILATIKRKGADDQVVLVKQYRPPMRADVLEFPAGLVDPKESVETTAKRELYEETGYTGKVERVSRALAMDPGASDCSDAMVVITIDGDLPENVNPEKHLDEGEHIEVLCLPVKGLLQKLDELSSQMTIDSRLYTFALGLSQ